MDRRPGNMLSVALAEQCGLEIGGKKKLKNSFGFRNYVFETTVQKLDRSILETRVTGPDSEAASQKVSLHALHVSETKA